MKKKKRKFRKRYFKKKVRKVSLKKKNKKISKKRKFEDGDVVFSKTQNCSDCDGKMLITKIFGETMD